MTSVHDDIIMSQPLLKKSFRGHSIITPSLDHSAISKMGFCHFMSFHDAIKFNGMLRHTFLRVGEDIFLQHILLPPLSFCYVCLSSILLFIACLPARAKRGMAIRAIKNKILDRQTEL